MGGTEGLLCPEEPHRVLLGSPSQVGHDITLKACHLLRSVLEINTRALRCSGWPWKGSQTCPSKQSPSSPHHTSLHLAPPCWMTSLTLGGCHPSHSFDVVSLSFIGFPDSSVGKESACSAGDLSSTPGSGRSAGERIGYPLQYSWASLVAQLIKNPPAMRETRVRSLGWEDPLEKGKATYSSILAWRIPCIVHGVAKSRTWLSNFHFHFKLWFLKYEKFSSGSSEKSESSISRNVEHSRL